jgi:hypothetical protein
MTVQSFLDNVWVGDGIVDGPIAGLEPLTDDLGVDLLDDAGQLLYGDP